MLALVFSAVIGSFLGASLLTQYVSSEIGSLSGALATHVATSIEKLASVHGSALEAEVALSLYLAGDATDAQRVKWFEESMSEAGAALEDYSKLPRFPGERGVHRDVQRAWARFEEAARNAENLARSGELAQAEQQLTRVDAAAQALVQAALRGVELNARQGRALAAEIGERRARAVFLSNALAGVCVLLGLAGAVLLHRQGQTARRLVDERAHALEQRAAELEQFAGRVAHDIRNPLSAASLMCDLIGTQVQDQEVLATVARLKRSLARANAITTDLLQFARSGAKPDPGARTSPHAIIADLAPQFDTEAAAQSITLRWETVPPALVACSEGVYLSLLSNLVRNAMKYMGSSQERRIVVAVRDEGAAVRTEVADTGPGIPEQSLGSLFEPYFRGDNARAADGLGLGLATVRKLAESHGGSVGVSSSVGRGSTFWFVLPKAGTRTPD